MNPRKPAYCETVALISGVIWSRTPNAKIALFSVAWCASRSAAILYGKDHHFWADFGQERRVVAPTCGLWRVTMACNTECTPYFQLSRQIAHHKSGAYPGGPDGVQYA
jgi:hypothetical protein